MPERNLEDAAIRKLISRADDDVQLQAIKLSAAVAPPDRPWRLSEFEALMDLSKQMTKLEKELA